VHAARISGAFAFVLVLSILGLSRAAHAHGHGGVGVGAGGGAGAACRYLLADNRHYTFYIWRLLFRRPGMLGWALPYALCVPYAFAGWCLLTDVGAKQPQ
jgi:hypothetical protein